MKNKVNKFEELKLNIKKYVTLKIYIISLGFLSIIYMLVGQILTSFIFALLCAMGFIIHEEYKRKINID